MSYTINHYNGTTLITGGLSDGTVDQTHTSLTLIGRDYAGYGAFLNENFIYLLENFAGSTSPSNPLPGQLWWDTNENVLNVWSGNSWKISTGATAAPANAKPTDLNASGGDLWFDTTNQQLNVYTGNPSDPWLIVGPQASSAVGNTGAIPTLMVDTQSVTHIVIQFVISGVVYAILSKDIFTQNQIAGFPIIKAGLNFNTNAGMVLSTQDVNATPNTLVQRDAGGSIAVAGITATTISASQITATSLNSGTFTGNLVGNVTATGAGQTITATTINTQGINASAGYTGTLLTASQPYITGVGTINTGVWQGSIINPTYGGTGVNNGSNTLTLNSSYTLNQSVASGASPTFAGTNFSSIPNGALTNNSVTVAAGTGMSDGGTVALGGTITLNNAGVTSLVAGTGVGVSASTGAVTVSIGQDVSTGAAPTFAGLTVNGAISATGDITAYSSSDAKFKENVRTIPNALNTAVSIGGKLFDWTDAFIQSKGGEDGYLIRKADFGVIAQDVLAVFPTAVRTRPDGSLAVDYEKLSALSFAALAEMAPMIAELRAEVADLKQKIK